MLSSFRVLLGVAAVFVAVIAANTIGPGTALADDTELDWCAYEDALGVLQFERITTKDTDGETRREFQDQHCRSTHEGGFHADAAFKSFYEETREDPFDANPLPETTEPEEFPDDWFRSLGPCLNLATTDATGDNRIQTVNIASVFVLVAQIVYDVASNEPTGIAGGVTGAILGVARIPHFVVSWVYDVQDECQEIVERNTIQEISAGLETHYQDIQNLAADLETHDQNQDLIKDKLDTIDVDVHNEFEQLSIWVSAIRAELDEVKDLVGAFESQTSQQNDQAVHLFIEDHLDTCSPLGSLLLNDDGGLLPVARDIVEDLITRSEAAGVNIGRARRELGYADYYLGRNDPRRVFKELCDAYDQLTGANGRGD